MLTTSQKKIIKSLHQKKFQQKYHKFIVETPKVVAELLDNPNFEVDSVCAISKWIDNHPRYCEKLGDKLHKINEKELGQISKLKTPNQVLTVVHKKSLEMTDWDKNWIIYLDDLQDPGNVGTIIRTADWFGVDQVIFSPNSVDPYNAKLIQASMGSFFRCKIYQGLALAFAESYNAGIFALDAKGTNIHKTEIQTPGILVVGNEGNGVSEDLLSNAKEILSIPSHGKAESLNAAMACGIALSILKN